MPSWSALAPTLNAESDVDLSRRLASAVSADRFCGASIERPSEPMSDFRSSSAFCESARDAPSWLTHFTSPSASFVNNAVLGPTVTGLRSPFSSNASGMPLPNRNGTFERYRPYAQSDHCW